MTAILKIREWPIVHRAPRNSSYIGGGQQQPPTRLETRRHGIHKVEVVDNVLDVLTAQDDVKHAKKIRSFMQLADIADLEGRVRRAADVGALPRNLLIARIPTQA